MAADPTVKIAHDPLRVDSAGCDVLQSPASEPTASASRAVRSQTSQKTTTAAASVGAGAALTATVAGACCIGPTLSPLIVGVLGVSGAVQLAGIKPYTPYLLGGSLVMLAYAFWKTYRRQGECGMKPARAVRAMLWASVLIWMLAAATRLSAADTFATLDGNAEPLRAAFNADAGKTRVILLVSPT